SNSVVTLPPDYIRKKNARLVGYQTPKAALESFLWALQNKDVTNFLNSVTATVAEKLASQNIESFLNSAAVLPGMRIRSQTDQPDGAVELEVEIMPGMEPQKLRVESVNGEWKLAGPF